MKRKLIVILAVTASVFLMTGCGKDKAAKEPVAPVAEEQAPDVVEEEYEEYYVEEPEGDIDGEDYEEQDDLSASEDGSDAGDVIDIADGEYVTDEHYKGTITPDGSKITIETALSQYDKDWNTIPAYDKTTYVFATSKDCKCVIYQEEAEEAPIAEKVDFISEFLKGESGLPITLKIKNNELIEISFSS